MNAILLRCGWVLARFHLWSLTVRLYGWAQPATRWDDRSRGSFAYACMLSRDRRSTRKIFAKMAEREGDKSPDHNLWLAKIAWSLGRMDLAARIYESTERISETAEQKQAAQALRRFIAGTLDGTISAAISDAVDKAGLPAPGTIPVVLTPVSSRYFDMFRLWSSQVEKHVRGHRVIMALDPPSLESIRTEFGLSAIDLSSYFVFGEDGRIDKYCRSLIWIFRVMLLRELVSRGYTVYSIDLDAIVIGDLEAMLSSFPESDVVAQKDYSIPMDVARRLGFIICCGFMILKPGRACSAFLDRYCEQTIQELDDQLALNHLLEKDKVTDRTTKAAYMSFQASGVSWICPDASLVSRDLHRGTVVRHFQQLGETIEELKQAMGL
jgi:hypothetical protein